VHQAEIGEIFVIRNAGNIIPPFGAANGGEGAAVEYAIHALGIEHIIVCGHSNCGAMKGLLKLDKLEAQMPLVYEWLQHAEATRRLIKENYTDLEGEELMDTTVAENVLTQLENLRTYPVIHSKMYQGSLQLHGWVYHIDTGEVYAYDPIRQNYFPLKDDWSGNDTRTEETVPEKMPPMHFPGAKWLPREQAERIYRGSYS